jgi:serine/threonine protein kinase
MAWASGQRLQGGKYTIEQELGEGGFGITYRAKNNNGLTQLLMSARDEQIFILTSLLYLTRILSNVPVL